MYINRQYLNMSNEELKRRLLARGMKSDLLEETLLFYAGQRSRIRAAKIKRAQQVLYWSALMRPLRAEINSVRAGLKYGEGDEARIEAFEAYLQVMVKLDGMLAPHYTSKGQTPGQLAKEKNASGKGSPITNNGATQWRKPLMHCHTNPRRSARYRSSASCRWSSTPRPRQDY